MIPERMTSATASISSWPRSGRAIGIMRALPPPDPPRGAADAERMRRHVAGDDRPGADGREAADVRAGDHDRPGPDRRAMTEPDRADRPVLGPGEVAGRCDCPGVAIVRQDRPGADEDAILDGHAVVDEGAVLDLRPIPDLDAPVDEDVAPDNALGTA